MNIIMITLFDENHEHHQPQPQDEETGGVSQSRQLLPQIKTHLHHPPPPHHHNHHCRHHHHHHNYDHRQHHKCHPDHVHIRATVKTQMNAPMGSFFAATSVSTQVINIHFPTPVQCPSLSKHAKCEQVA